MDVHGSLGQTSDEHLLIGAGVLLGPVHALQRPVGPVDVMAVNGKAEWVDGRVNDHLPVVTVQVTSLNTVSVRVEVM